MRSVEGRISVSGRVRSYQRQVSRICKIDQRGLRRLLDRVVPARNLDIEAIWKQRLQAVEIGIRLRLLAIGDQPRNRPFRPSCQCD